MLMFLRLQIACAILWLPGFEAGDYLEMDCYHPVPTGNEYELCTMEGDCTSLSGTHAAIRVWNAERVCFNFIQNGTSLGVECVNGTKTDEWETLKSSDFSDVTLIEITVDWKSGPSLHDHKIPHLVDGCQDSDQCRVIYQESCPDPCNPNPCANDGICIRGSEFDESYTCTCKMGFTGTNCEDQIPDQCIIKTTGGNSPAGSKCYFPFVDDDGVTQNETCAVRANGITRYCYTNAEGTVWAECETETCLDREDYGDCPAVATTGGNGQNKECVFPFVHYDYTVLGCFVDTTGDRDLPHFSTPSALTHQECIAYCVEKGYMYAGLQAGTHCFCDNSYGKHGEKPMSECSSACPGDTTQKCGAGWRNTVLLLAKNLGCYASSALSSLDIPLPENPVSNMKPGDCINKCSALGYPYAGSVDGTHCYCGDSFDLLQVHSDNCDVPCPNKTEMICGGESDVTVYTTDIRQIYTGCTTKDRNEDGMPDQAWCATTEDYERDGKWGNCKVQTYGGNGYFNDCYFPFEYNGDTYYGCTEVDSVLGPWCKTVNDSGDPTDNFGFCVIPNDDCGACSETKTTGGNAVPAGSDCVFPFTYYSGLSYSVIGCFVDYAGAVRDLPHHMGSFGDMTHEKCVIHCNSQGYLYAGLQIGTHCFCGNDYGKQGEKFDCTSACAGDSSQICGQGFRNTVLLAAREVGCYANTVSHGSEIMLEDMTVQSCMEYCHVNMSSTYAAMRDGMYCSCGVSAYGEEDSGAVCDVPCDGDNTTTCGGVNHYTVYTTKMRNTLFECTHADRDWNGQEESRAWCATTNNYPEDRKWGNCIVGQTTLNALTGDTSHPDECHFPFHHDGVQYDECTSVDHTQPWCYLDIAGQVSGEWKNCILPVCDDCADVSATRDGNAKPEGSDCALPFKWADSIYLGCYVDSLTRDLPFHLAEAYMTYQKCFNFCLSQGYLYAGLQFSTHCYCGNDVGTYGLANKEAECASPCSGDHSVMCGGGWRNTVFMIASYVGCYTSHNMHTAEVELVDMTVKDCVEYCHIAENSTYAAMRNGSLCSCGNEPYGPETSDDCNVPCVDGKMCGGENVYSVYTTNPDVVVVEHSECTHSDRYGDGEVEQQAWCATTNDSLDDGVWGICMQPRRSEGAITGNDFHGIGNPPFCHFPFTYKGVTYHGCTTEDNNSEPWCYLDDWGHLTTSTANCQVSNCVIDDFGKLDDIPF